MRQKQQHRVTHGIDKRTVNNTIEKSMYSVCKCSKIREVRQWSIYCLTSLILLHLHTLYIWFSIVLLTVHLFMCNSVLLFLSHCFDLSWPGRSYKWELVLSWPTWLNKDEVKYCKNLLTLDELCTEDILILWFFKNVFLLCVICIRLLGYISYNDTIIILLPFFGLGLIYIYAS